MFCCSAVHEEPRHHRRRTKLPTEDGSSTNRRTAGGSGSVSDSKDPSATTATTGGDGKWVPTSPVLLEDSEAAFLAPLRGEFAVSDACGVHGITTCAPSDAVVLAVFLLELSVLDSAFFHGLIRSSCVPAARQAQASSSNPAVGHPLSRKGSSAAALHSVIAADPSVATDGSRTKNNGHQGAAGSSLCDRLERALERAAESGVVGATWAVSTSTLVRAVAALRASSEAQRKQSSAVMKPTASFSTKKATLAVLSGALRSIEGHAFDDEEEDDVGTRRNAESGSDAFEGSPTVCHQASGSGLLMKRQPSRLSKAQIERARTNGVNPKNGRRESSGADTTKSEDSDEGAGEGKPNPSRSRDTSIEPSRQWPSTEEAVLTPERQIVFVHGFGGGLAMWLPQLRCMLSKAEHAKAQILAAAAALPFLNSEEREFFLRADAKAPVGPDTVQWQEYHPEQFAVPEPDSRGFSSSRSSSQNTGSRGAVMMTPSECLRAHRIDAMTQLHAVDMPGFARSARAELRLQRGDADKAIDWATQRLGGWLETFLGRPVGEENKEPPSERRVAWAAMSAEKERGSKRPKRRQEVVLVGHSFGSYMSTHTAMRYPSLIDRLVLADPWGVQNLGDGPLHRMSLPRRAKMHLEERVLMAPMTGLRAAGPAGKKLFKKLRADFGDGWRPHLEDDSIFYDYIYHCNCQPVPTGEALFIACCGRPGFAEHPLSLSVPNGVETRVPIAVVAGSTTWLDIPSMEEMVRERKQVLDDTADLAVATTATVSPASTVRQHPLSSLLKGTADGMEWSPQRSVTAPISAGIGERTLSGMLPLTFSCEGSPLMDRCRESTAAFTGAADDDVEDRTPGLRQIPTQSYLGGSQSRNEDAREDPTPVGFVRDRSASVSPSSMSLRPSVASGGIATSCGVIVRNNSNSKLFTTTAEQSSQQKGELTTQVASENPPQQPRIVATQPLSSLPFLVSQNASRRNSMRHSDSNSPPDENAALQNPPSLLFNSDESVATRAPSMLSPLRTPPDSSRPKTAMPEAPFSTPEVEAPSPDAARDRRTSLEVPTNYIPGHINVGGSGGLTPRSGNPTPVQFSQWSFASAATPAQPSVSTLAGDRHGRPFVRGSSVEDDDDEFDVMPARASTEPYEVNGSFGHVSSLMAGSDMSALPSVPPTVPVASSGQGGQHGQHNTQSSGSHQNGAGVQANAAGPFAHAHHPGHSFAMKKTNSRLSSLLTRIGSSNTVDSSATAGAESVGSSALLPTHPQSTGSVHGSDTTAAMTVVNAANSQLQPQALPPHHATSAISVSGLQGQTHPGRIGRRGSLTTGATTVMPLSPVSDASPLPPATPPAITTVLDNVESNNVPLTKNGSVVAPESLQQQSTVDHSIEPRDHNRATSASKYRAEHRHESPRSDSSPANDDFAGNRGDRIRSGAMNDFDDFNNDAGEKGAASKSRRQVRSRERWSRDGSTKPAAAKYDVEMESEEENEEEEDDEEDASPMLPKVPPASTAQNMRSHFADFSYDDLTEIQSAQRSIATTPRHHHHHQEQDLDDAFPAHHDTLAFRSSATAEADDDADRVHPLVPMLMRTSDDVPNRRRSGSLSRPSEDADLGFAGQSRHSSKVDAKETGVAPLSVAEAGMSLGMASCPDVNAFRVLRDSPSRGRDGRSINASASVSYTVSPVSGAMRRAGADLGRVKERVIGNVSFEVVPDAGHQVCSDNAPVFNEALLRGLEL